MYIVIEIICIVYCCFRMVLEPKGEPDGIENSISAIRGVSYSCNENRSKEYVHIEIDMPPANGHLVSIYN